GFFPVGWAIAFMPLVARAAFGVGLPDEPFIIAATWLGLLLPALVITRMVDGTAGLRVLFRGIVKIRASVGWYALALLAVPLVSLAVAYAFYGAPNLSLEALLVGLGLQTVIGLVTTNLWEE